MRCYGVTTKATGNTYYFQRKRDAMNYVKRCDPLILPIFSDPRGYLARQVTVRDDIPSCNIIKANQY